MYLETQRYFVLRIVAAVPLPIWITCACYAVVVYLVLRAALVWAGADLSEPVYARSLLLIPFLAGYMSMLSPVVARSTTTLARELTPALRAEAESTPRLDSTYSLSTGSLWLWTLVFQLVPAAAQLIIIEQDSTADWVIFGARQILFLHYTFYIFLYAQLRGTSQFINREVTVSLHHRHELLPIGRVGVQLASVVALALTVVGIVQIAMSADIGVLLMTAIMASPGYALVLCAIWMPTNPARIKIRHAKLRELDRINRAIKANESIDLFGQPIAGLALLSYRDRVEDVDEWPMDLRTFRTITVFFVLPVFSWVAAAFVAMWVEQAMAL